MTKDILYPEEVKEKAMEATKRRYFLEIKPAIPPADRHEIEDALKKLGYSVSGGGQMVDGSGSDISFKGK